MDVVQEIALAPRKRAKRKARPLGDLEALRSADLLSIAQWCVVNPAFSPGGVRWRVFKEGEKLERAGAIVRVGRRVLLRPKKFLDYLLSEPERRDLAELNRASRGVAA